MLRDASETHEDDEAENDEPALFGIIRAEIISAAMWLAIIALCYVACSEKSEAQPRMARGGTTIKAPYDWTC